LAFKGREFVISTFRAWQQKHNKLDLAFKDREFAISIFRAWY